MASNIDATKPVAGSPTTDSVRVNFLAAKNEITQIQDSRMFTGFIALEDTFTNGTPLPLVANTWKKITNNGLGANTLKTYKPASVNADTVWDTVNNRFVWGSNLILGDMVDIRLDIEITTTTANQIFFLSMFHGVGATEYEIQFASGFYKTAGTYRLAEVTGFYMGNTLTLNNYSEIRIKSDSDATVKVNGFYVKFDLPVKR